MLFSCWLFLALPFCYTHGRSPCLVWLKSVVFFIHFFHIHMHCRLHSGIFFLCRDYLSPSDIMGNYPYLVVLGTGLAFGFLVVRYFCFGVIIHSIEVYTFFNWIGWLYYYCCYIAFPLQFIYGLYFFTLYGHYYI